MSAPMTAEEIRKEWLDRIGQTRVPGCDDTESTLIMLVGFAHRTLDALSAREREHAELLTRVERLEATVRSLDGRTSGLVRCGGPEAVMHTPTRTYYCELHTYVGSLPCPMCCTSVESTAP